MFFQWSTEKATVEDYEGKHYTNKMHDRDQEKSEKERTQREEEEVLSKTVMKAWLLYWYAHVLGIGLQAYYGWGFIPFGLDIIFSTLPYLQLSQDYCNCIEKICSEHGIPVKGNVFVACQSSSHSVLISCPVKLLHKLYYCRQ